MKKLLLAFIVFAPFGLAAPASAVPFQPSAASSADPVVTVGHGHGRGHGMRGHRSRGHGHGHGHRRRHHHH